MTTKLKPGDWVRTVLGFYCEVLDVMPTLVIVRKGLERHTIGNGAVEDVLPCSPEHMARITRAAMAMSRERKGAGKKWLYSPAADAVEEAVHAAERADKIWRALQWHTRERYSRGEACEGLVVTKHDMFSSVDSLTREVDAITTERDILLAKVDALQRRTDRHDRAKNLGQAVEGDAAIMARLTAERDALRHVNIGGIGGCQENTTVDVLALMRERDRMRAAIHTELLGMQTSAVPYDGAQATRLKRALGEG
jgi:hypothetical protein